METEEISENENIQTVWETFLNGLNGFTEDFMSGGRKTFIPSEREEL